MKVLIREINNETRYQYTLVDRAKFHDDCDSFDREYFSPPMMIVNEILDDDSVSQENLVFPITPEISELFLNFNIFSVPRLLKGMRYSFKNNYHDRIPAIEFDLKKIKYPYLDYFDEKYYSFKCYDERLEPLVSFPQNIKQIVFRPKSIF